MKPSKLVGLTSLLEKARAERYAVAAFNFCDAETAQAIVDQCAELRSPAVLITGDWEMPLLGAEMMADIAASLASRTDVPVCLQLDHATDLELVRQCIKAGFSSVMIDASGEDFQRNVRLTSCVVEMARATGVDVEAELGSVGSVDEGSAETRAKSELTDPDKAAEFVELTGVQALAVAIGNAHGVYPQRPVLDFDRLAAIHKATSVPLVLHGGSGTPPDQLRRAIELGISKVNVATDLSRAFMEGFHQAVVASGDRTWYAEALKGGKDATAPVIRRWVNAVGCAGRAG